MYIETTTKITLNDKEKQTLKEALKIVIDMFDKTNPIEGEVDFEDDVLDILDDLQANIRYFI